MATGIRASVGENKQPSSLPCAHCRKTISGPESPKFLNDVLCIRRAKSENTEFSVLDALAQVFGVRLTVDSAVTCDQLCICGSCLGLLQRLFLAHLQFSKKNSSIIRELGVNCNEQSARAPSHSDNSTQTDSLDTNTNGHMADAGSSREIRPEVDLVKHRHVLQSGIKTRRALRVRLPHGRIEIESARILADMKTANTISVRGKKDDLGVKKRQPARNVEEDHDYIPFDEDNDGDSNSFAEENTTSQQGRIEMQEEEESEDVVPENKKKQRKVRETSTQEVRCRYPECSSVNQVFTPRDLVHHRLTAHGPPGKSHELKRKRNPPPKKYICEVEGCGKSYISPGRLTVHSLTHLPKSQRAEALANMKNGNAAIVTTEKTHICKIPDCGQSFGGILELRKHVRTHTSLPEPVFGCTICSKRFARTRDRNLHVMQVHCAARDFLCTECGKTYKSRSNLLNHRRIHTINSVTCEKCGIGFNTARALEMHVQVHTGERPISCVVCGKGFSTKKNLRGHMMVHKNTRRHKCRFASCTAGFNYRHHLRNHLSGYHSLDPGAVEQYLEKPEADKL